MIVTKIDQNLSIHALLHARPPGPSCARYEMHSDGSGRCNLNLAYDGAEEQLGEVRRSSGSSKDSELEAMLFGAKRIY